MESAWVEARRKSEAERRDFITNIIAEFENLKDSEFPGIDRINAQPWAMEPETQASGTTITAGEMEWMFFDEGHPRISLRGYYPKGPSGQYYEVSASVRNGYGEPITFSIERKPRLVARDIARRFVPGFLHTHDLATWMRGEEVRKRELLATIAGSYKVAMDAAIEQTDAPFVVRWDTHENDNAYKRMLALLHKDTYRRAVTLDVRVDSVSIETGPLQHEVGLSFLRALMRKVVK